MWPVSGFRVRPEDAGGAMYGDESRLDPKP